MTTKVNVSQAIDSKDRKILELVQRDAKAPQSEIAKHVGLSTAAVNERLRKLENSGVIRGWSAVVDARAVGATVAAFVEVSIEHPRHEAAFLDKLLALPEVQECHHITGEFSLLLKVRVRDMDGLRDLLLHRLNGMDGVRQTRTMMVLSTAKEECFIPTVSKGEAP
jgi:Lrp/AsnC family leucine-responsive transcriptional regulator